MRFYKYLPLFVFALCFNFFAARLNAGIAPHTNKPALNEPTKPKSPPRPEHKQTNSDGHKLSKSNSHKLSNSDGHKPSSSYGHKPSKSGGHKPSKSDSHEPSSSDSHEPLRSDGYKPSKSDSREPSSSDGYKPSKALADKQEAAKNGVTEDEQKEAEKRAKEAEEQKKEAERQKKDEALQDKLLRKDVLNFVKENQNRQAGEGWLYLAEHYKDLKMPERSLAYLDTLLRSSGINPRLIWQARLLRAQIYKEQKEFALALKDLKKLIESNPARAYEIKAKIAKAEILGRNLTTLEELFKAFKKYYYNFPQQKELEAIQYIMGFERGYDLEIAMSAMQAYEEIANCPEAYASDIGSLHLGLMYAFDLNAPDRAKPFFNKICKDSKTYFDAAFAKALIEQFYSKKPQINEALNNYALFRKHTQNLDGYRIAGILQAMLLSENIKDCDAALNTLSSLFETPKHLIASESISVERINEAKEDELDWAVLASRAAGYICEFKMNNLERARYYYQKSKDSNEQKRHPKKDPFIEAALERTAPSQNEAQILFEKAYEKYRSGFSRQALSLYKSFISKYPNSELCREARYRAAVITDDALREYDKALDMYQNYLISFAPIKSNWKLDVLYDWERIDEVRYRIGNLLALHLKKPVDALDIYAELAKTYPDSYWAMQGIKDSIKIYQEDLEDPDKANELRQDFINAYPETKDASDFRLYLYKIFLQKNEQVKALHMLRSYLDHALPSAKNYFSYKEQWRDLAFRIREESIRGLIKTAGTKDLSSLYVNLADVFCLASTSLPLEGLINEIKAADINDSLRYSLVYEAGTRLYQAYPNKAAKVFDELAQNATGTSKLASLLTLGNIAYRVDKNIKNAVKYYEEAEKLLPLTGPHAEVVCYRLGRLYLAQGMGLKGLEKLRLFTARFTRSRYLAKAYKTMGDACCALHNPQRGVKYYKRALRIEPKAADKINKLIEEAKKQPTSEEWLQTRLNQKINENKAKSALKTDDNRPKPSLAKKDKAEITEKDLMALEAGDVYEMYLNENQKQKPRAKYLDMLLINILRRDSEEYRERALKHFISNRFFRFKKAKLFVENAQSLLTEHNYAEWLSELLFRMAQAKDYYLKDYEGANKAYFEYLSFFSKGKRVVEARRRIPEVYNLSDDQKNARRFFERLIDDKTLTDEIRADASVKLALMLLKNEEKKDAITFLEAALAFKSEKQPEICLRLEKMTDDFSYVKRALEAQGLEKDRFKALKRVIAAFEEKTDYKAAAEAISDFADTFKEPEAMVWLEKKANELSKRGAISEIEALIERYPEDAQTASRMFRLAKMVEGAENTRYRSQDLFYEITLVYPDSEFYKESKIRAENTRAIKAAAELSDMLKKGTKGRESEEILIERARLLKDSLKDTAQALECYESFIALFPNSAHIDEVYLSLGELELSEEKNTQRALEYFEKGLAKSSDPFMREKLTEKINSLKLFAENVLYSDNPQNNEIGLNEVFKALKIDKNPLYAIGLLKSALSVIENRPDAARINYYLGRIYEDQKNIKLASEAYKKALRCLYHPKCRKDMILYRLARMYAAQNNPKEAEEWYRRLINRYPKSLLSRSGYYWLFKLEEKNNNLSKAHYLLDNLICFASLNPIHKKALAKKLNEIEAQMNIKELERLQNLSKHGGANIGYFAGKILEYDLLNYDEAIKKYEEFLQTNPPVRQSREIMNKIAELYEKKREPLKAIRCYDMLLDTFEPSIKNFELIIKIGSLIEDEIGDNELIELFYSSILSQYKKIRKIRIFAEQKLVRLQEKKIAAAKPKAKKKIKRVYSEDDEAVIEEMQAIIERQVNDLQDYKKAERELEDLWNDNIESLATLDIMKELVKLNIDYLQDPNKAADYYQKWLNENQSDPLYKENTMLLYALYTDVLHDGDKALRLLEDYIKDNPITPESLDIELKVALANEQLLKSYDEARRVYQRIIDTKYNDPVVHEAYYRMGFVLREGFSDYTGAISIWNEQISKFYNNDFADDSQFAIAYTYEVYVKDYTSARAAYNKILNTYPNSSFQQQARDSLLRIEGK